MALLIQRGAEIDAQEQYGWSPLWLLFYDEQRPLWEAGPDRLATVHRCQEKMELLLRNGAKFDSWTDPADKKGPSLRTVNLACLVGLDMVSFMMKKTTAMNMSTEKLERLAAGLLAYGEYDSALSVYKHHGPFHLEAREIEAWELGDEDTVLDPLDPGMRDDVLEYAAEVLGTGSRECIMNWGYTNYLQRRREAFLRDPSMI